MIKIIKGNKVKKTALSLAICVAMAIPTVSSALSLGEIQSNSSLNQPFKGKIHLLSANASEAQNLRVRVASPDVFNRVGIDRPSFLNSIRFNPTVENGRPVILVSSNQAINEPFLNFLLEVSWPNGQLLKEYTVLLDPPILSRPDTAIASNTAGIRAEPARAQGRISRPAIQPARRVQQPRRVVRAAAPRPAPARRAPVRRPAPAASRAASANRVSSYRVRRGDTLTKVASKLGYSGIRSEQMMVALFQKNRSAFTKNNMNNLKAGVRLNRPSLQEARALSARSAKSQIIAQAREWKKSRTTAVAKNTPKATNNATQVASNQQARLEVSGNNSSNQKFANGTGSKAIADLNKQLTMLTESLTTKKNENEELKSRVSELESLLRKKNRLITLKSEQLATLQELVGSPVDETAGAQQPAIVETIVDDAVVAEGTDIQTQVENTTANENGQIIRVENDQNAVMAQNQQPVPIEESQLTNQSAPVEEVSPFTQDVVTEKPTDIMGLLSSPLAMGVGGGSLLALLGGLWFMRRRKNSEYEEFDYESEINIDNAVPVDKAEEQLEDVDTAAVVEVPEIDESELVEHDGIRHEHMKNSGLLDDDQEDLLQEADVYIVYGLHDQAESELKQAISKEPNNLAYRAKLLENYKAAGNKDAFTEEAKIFMGLDVEGKEEYLDDISEWGSALIPESNLFSGDSLKTTIATATGAGVAMVAGTAIAQDENTETEKAKTSDSESSMIDFDNEGNDIIEGFSEVDLDSDDGLESFDLDDVLADDSEVDLIDNIDLDLNELDGDNDDLDLKDFSFDNESGLIDDIEVDPISMDMGNEPLEIGDVKAEPQEIDSLDPEDIDVEITPEVDDEVSAIADLNDDTQFDFDPISLDDEFETADLDVDFKDLNDGLDTESTDDNMLDLTSLNLDLDADDFDKIMPEDHQYKSTSNSDEVSVDGVSDNKVEENLLAEFDDNLSFLDLDNEDTDIIEETHIETKLDLAKAYIDMGDIEGARSTLEEVLQEGSDEQKRVAEELLHQTG